MRYGLRTLFVVLTLLCCALGYLGYGLNWARERQQFMRENKQIFFEWENRKRPARRESRLLSLVGEAPLAAIYVTVPTIAIQPDGSEVQVPDRSNIVSRIKRLFPEADVIANPYRVMQSDSAP